ncbi:hypothetical protein QF001_001618 [Paraburkholderia youngii]
MAKVVSDEAPAIPKGRSDVVGTGETVNRTKLHVTSGEE